MYLGNDDYSDWILDREVSKRLVDGFIIEWEYFVNTSGLKKKDI